MHWLSPLFAAPGVETVLVLDGDGFVHDRLQACPPGPGDALAALAAGLVRRLARVHDAPATLGCTYPAGHLWLGRLDAHRWLLVAARDPRAIAWCQTIAPPPAPRKDHQPPHPPPPPLHDPDPSDTLATGRTL